MAAGDPVTSTGSVSGSSTATISVPSGETWVLSGVGKSHGVGLAFDDGTNSGKMKMPANATAESTSDMATRGVFPSGSVDPAVDNINCGSEPYYIGGREI